MNLLPSTVFLLSSSLFSFYMVTTLNQKFNVVNPMVTCFQSCKFHLALSPLCAILEKVDNFMGASYFAKSEGGGLMEKGELDNFLLLEGGASHKGRTFIFQGGS